MADTCCYKSHSVHAASRKAAQKRQQAQLEETVKAAAVNDFHIDFVSQAQF